jgi:hypothetical protein
MIIDDHVGIQGNGNQGELFAFAFSIPVLKVIAHGCR